MNIKRPSVLVQKYGNAIEYIKNASEEVQKLAVQQNGNAIEYIKNASEEVQKLSSTTKW